jgi:hypothetical protein
MRRLDRGRRSWRSAATALVLFALFAGSARAIEIPPGLPSYEVDIRVDVSDHRVTARQRVTWTNRHDRPAGELVFNVFSHFKLPGKDVGRASLDDPPSFPRSRRGA